MKNLELILSSIATISGLAVTALTFIIKFVKSAKAKRAAENLIKIGNEVVSYIEQAEKFVGYIGKEKKEYVMTKVNQFAINNRMNFDAEQTSKKIEELVKLTKDVNNEKKIDTAKTASQELN